MRLTVDDGKEHNSLSFLVEASRHRDASGRDAATIYFVESTTNVLVNFLDLINL